MEGLYIVRKDDPSHITAGAGAGLTLYLKRPNLEIMRQRILVSDTAWIAPADTPGMIEVFYLLSGELEIHRPDGGIELMEPGDMFYVDRLTHDIRMSARTECEVIYITNLPVFDGVAAFQRDLNSLLMQINDKDCITLTHSRNVKRYAVLLYDELKPEGIALDDMVTAALFHDVGKCYVPTEILCKDGKLTPEEYELIKLHASNSYDILLNCFGHNVADLARGHHERLDGSGYPDGTNGADIGMGARIIAVADVCDAMTGRRSYKKAKPPEEAISELRRFPHHFDQTVVEALASIHESGRLPLLPDVDITEEFISEYFTVE